MWSIISPSVKCELRFSLGGVGREERVLESLVDIVENLGEAEDDKRNLVVISMIAG